MATLLLSAIHRGQCRNLSSGKRQHQGSQAKNHGMKKDIKTQHQTRGETATEIRSINPTSNERGREKGMKGTDPTAPAVFYHTSVPLTHPTDHGTDGACGPNPNGAAGISRAVRPPRRGCGGGYPLPSYLFRGEEVTGLRPTMGLLLGVGCGVGLQVRVV